MTKQRCQFFGIVTGRRLDLIPEPYRSLFAMWRCADAKRANKPRRDRDLLNRKLRDIERLKRDLVRGGLKRITHTGELACECRWCGREANLAVSLEGRRLRLPRGMHDVLPRVHRRGPQAIPVQGT
jgi:hypothetical protein